MKLEFLKKKLDTVFCSLDSLIYARLIGFNNAHETTTIESIRWSTMDSFHIYLFINSFLNASY